MEMYRYYARDSQGKAVSGAVDGQTELDAARRVISLGLWPVRVRKRHFAFTAIGGTGYLSSDELISFTSRLSTLLSSGVTLEAALDSIMEQSGPAMKSTAGEIKRRVLEGEPLSSAMAKTPSVFPEVYTAMVEVGEASGTLDRSLGQLARFLTRREEIREATRDAVRYPKMVLTVLGAGLFILLGWVIPRYAEIFEKANLALPLPTRMLIASGHFVSNHWLAMIASLGVIVIAFRWWGQTPNGRRAIDESVLKIPALGGIILNASLARWADAFGCLAGAGAPLIGSIGISARACGNVYISKKLSGIAGAVMEGSGISEPLAQTKILPPVTAQIIATGEMAGTLDKAFAAASEHSAKEAERGVKKLSAYAEPALVVVLSVVVLFVALSVFMPMWEMTKMARMGR